MKKLVLIDGNSIMNRAFYATMGRNFTSPDGKPTNALYGFLPILFRMVEDEKPNYLAVSFDLKGENKRKQIYSEYKAGRHSMPEDLRIQMDMIKDILRKMNIPIYEKAGEEADDILGTISKKITKNHEIKVCILTGDRDYFQLVDSKIYIKYPKTSLGKTEYIIYDEEKIKTEYTLLPNDLIELKALMGDSSDNIPGVKGIGEKTAIKLLKEYSNLENLYEKIESGENKIPKGQKEKLIIDKENAFLSRLLGEININLDIEELNGIENELEKLKYETWKNKAVSQKLISLNMKSIVDKYGLKQYLEESTLDILEENKSSSKMDLNEGEESLDINDYDTEEIFIDEDKTEEYLNSKYQIIFNSYEESLKKFNSFKEKIKDKKEIYLNFNSISLISDRNEENLEKKELDILNTIYKEEKLYTLDNRREYIESISKEKNIVVDVLVEESDSNKVEIYKYTIDEIKDILEDANIKKNGHGLKRHLVYLKEKGINLLNIDLDTEIASYLLDSNLNKYDILEVSLRNLKMDITKLCEKNFELEKLYKLMTKEENKVITNIKKLVKKGFNIENIQYSNSLLDFEEDEETEKYNKIKSELKELNEIYTNKIKNIYNEKDYLPLIIYILCKKLKKELIAINNLELYEKVEKPLIYVLADMQNNGIYINKDKLENTGRILKKQVKEIEEKILDIAGYTFNISSPKQLGKLLFEDLNLPVVKKTKTGYSTDVDALNKLKDKHEIIEYILEYREITKLISTYIDGLKVCINPNTNKVHSSFNQTVTATGRLSSTEPNMQNIPVRKEYGKEIRKLFEPENYIFLDADYSQIELRVLADMSGDKTMIEAFKENIDIHKSTASTIFNVPLEEVTSELRSYAKAVNFGIIYGISDYGLSESTGLQVREAKEYISKYLEKYKDIHNFMEKVIEFGKENGYVETKYKRRRYLPNINSKNYIIREQVKRIAMNAPIQGTAADIMKIAMINIYEKMKKENLKSKLVLQVHDEILIDVVEKEEEIVKEIMKNEMEKASNLKVKLQVDIESGKNWNEAK